MPIEDSLPALPGGEGFELWIDKISNVEISEWMLILGFLFLLFYATLFTEWFNYAKQNR